MAIAKQRRSTYDVIGPPIPRSTTTTTTTASAKLVAETSNPQRNGSGVNAVLLARPLVNKATASTAKAKTSLSSTTSGPPVLKIDLKAHSKPQFRQAVAMQYYNEFLRIYKPLGSLGCQLATTHAIDQEKSVHTKTNQGSYRSLASSILQRLKKRPEATMEHDTGIDGEWVDPATIKTTLASDIWSEVAKYVHPIEKLKDNGYPVEIPQEGDVIKEKMVDDVIQECDRCHKQFVVHATLEEGDKAVCQYHDRRITRRLVNGERIKLHACCDGIQGSTGCRDGPHVFKEDNFGLLHHRIPFVKASPRDREAEKKEEEKGEGKKKHRVVAMDCEMCYTAGGFELIRISAVGHDGKTILDELVKPKHEIFDLNSRFSGITSLDGAKYDLEQARDHFLDLIDEDTVIIGQSLENDFKVLRLVHNQVVDTAMLFLHPFHNQGHRYSLQILAKQHLKINIQDGEHGHDSFEDAKTCLDLVRVWIEKDKQGIKIV
ncbi:RNA exonuclease 3 [Podila humilis]|nr:RNA exonuclease 3 [Podila humilis]